MIDKVPEEFKKDLYYGKSFDSVVVPKRYAERVVGHVVANYLPNNHYFNPPLYLAIKGVPGEGKTLQALAACNQRGIMVKYLSSSELSGEMEAASLEVIKSIYIQAMRMQEMGYYICILLDDFHLGNSNICSNSSHTVNAELLVGYMMNLAESSKQKRVPIILTGNDFSNTYEALLRDGRADIFEWTPWMEEKQLVVRSILQNFVHEGELQRLDVFIKKYSEQSVAFFAQIKDDIRRKIVCDSLADIDRIDKVSMKKISDSIERKLTKIDVSILHQIAEERVVNRKRGGV